MTRGRKRTGTVEWHDDHWDVRPTLADGSRGLRVCQPKGMSEARARDRAQALTDLAAEKGTVRAPAEADVAPEPAPTPAPASSSGPAPVSLAAWTDAWCADRERRGLSSVEDDRGRLRKWILPRLSPPLGSRPAASIQRADLQALVEDLDGRVLAEELSWKTAKNAWGVVTKMCKDMVKSKVAALRIREDNPAADVAGPDEGVKKSKAYLYPAEFLALVRCARVPIRWRRLFAVNVYSYTRAGELEALGVEDVDIAHRVVHVHRAIDRSDGEEKETKTNSPRRFPIEGNLLPLIERMAAEARAANEDRLLKMPPISDLSARLRQYLEWAGVTRAELFANDATRKQITFHDLRATGITWMAVRGDEPQKIMHRAGHENMSTTIGYIREAEALDYLRGDVFPPLPEELFLPGILPEGPATWAVLREDQQVKRRPQRDSNPLQGPASEGDRRGADGDAPPRTRLSDADKCPEPGGRAESRAESGAGWPGLIAGARATAAAAPCPDGDERSLLVLYLEELEEITGPRPNATGGSA